jgi:hypothetical protein
MARLSLLARAGRPDPAFHAKCRSARGTYRPSSFDAASWVMWQCKGGLAGVVGDEVDVACHADAGRGPS